MNTVDLSAKPIPAAVAELLEKGFTHVQLDVSQMVQDAIPHFLRLLVDPHDTGPICFDIDYKPGAPGSLLPVQHDPDQGLVQKGHKANPDGTWEDPKRYFHFRPSLLPQLVAHNPEFLLRHAELLQRCNQIWEICKAHVTAMGHSMDLQMPGYNFGSNLHFGRNHVLRFLAYEGIREA